MPDVKAFSDESIAEHVQVEFMSDLQQFVKVHTILGQYFSGKWSGTFATNNRRVFVCCVGVM